MVFNSYVTPGKFSLDDNKVLNDVYRPTISGASSVNADLVSIGMGRSISKPTIVQSSSKYTGRDSRGKQLQMPGGVINQKLTQNITELYKRVYS